ncbi:MAG: methylated-DNA-protein-cysteine methyltransferase-like protein [Colwellia sp.]
MIDSPGKISILLGSDNFDKQKYHLQDEQVLVIASRIKIKDFQWQPDLSEILFLLEF